MFVRYECGCIGIPVTGTTLARIISACDVDAERPAESLSWAERGMDDKTFEPVSVTDERRLHAQMADRLYRGDRFDEVQRALGIVEASPFVDRR